MPAQVIKISRACQHNLKNLHVEIPREELVVITDLSGRGSPRWRSTLFMAKDNAAMFESLRLMRGNFLIKWMRRMPLLGKNKCFMRPLILPEENVGRSWWEFLGKPAEKPGTPRT